MSPGPSSTPASVRLGTRGSALALTQANMVKARLESHWPGLSVQLVIIKTSGDANTKTPLYAIGGKALFVKELEEALADGRIDLAVHSCKDVPAFIPPGMEITCTLPREDARDAFISHKHASLGELPQGATIGSSSPRRAAQLLYLRPDLQIVPLRGNVDTRLRKLEEEGLDAIILAMAGLKRLGLADRVTEAVDKQTMLPCGGQGAIAIEIRASDDATRRLLGPLHDVETGLAIEAERAFLAAMNGSCTTPLGVFATRLASNELVLEGLLAAPSGAWLVRRRQVAPIAQGKALGKALADAILHDAFTQHGYIPEQVA
ncbi:hydroxymethylbilane synthase [bacterium]|nr:hydroxymethylbilane synthase [bacterium]